MKVIYKYPLNLTEENVIEAQFERLLDVQFQYGQLVAWAIINDRQPESKVLFKIFGTGWETEDFSGKCLKTLQDTAGFVWHIFVEAEDESVINTPAAMP